MSETKIIDFFAGPFNAWGPEKEVYSVFNGSGCRLRVAENNTNGNIRIQTRYNTDNQSRDWAEYLEGTHIKADVVHCRISSTSTGGSVKLAVSY